MRKSRFSESQILKILKEAEGGRKVADVCREYKVSQATYYKATRVRLTLLNRSSANKSAVIM